MAVKYQGGAKMGGTTFRRGQEGLESILAQIARTFHLVWINGDIHFRLHKKNVVHLNIGIFKVSFIGS